MNMFSVTVFILTFLFFFQNSISQSTQPQNGYNYPQNVGRQANPAAGQQLDANGNPIMSGTAQGQPVGSQQSPVMSGTGNMPSMGVNPMTPQNIMPNQQFSPQNPGGTIGSPNQQPQFPQNQFSGPNQPFPQNQFSGPGQQYSQNQYTPNQYPQNQFSGINPQYPNQHAGVHYPEPPTDMHLTPDGVYAYGYMMHIMQQILNNPMSRNNLLHILNNLEMTLSNPRSTPIIQEFFTRWLRALTDSPVGQTGTYPTNVVVENPSSTFFDTLKRKGNTLINLAKDVTMAKTKALNSLFDNSIFSPAVQVGTNWMNAGMQGVQGTVSPLIGTTPSTGRQILTTTTPHVTVQA